MANQPQLSAILVVGRCRARSQRALDALGAQTARDAMEIVVVDVTPPEIPRLAPPAGIPTIYRSCPASTLWSRARAEGVRQASAPIVAFIEDHCYPTPPWAACLIEAHKSPWAAVGYAFVNANPHNYVARAGMINDYGPWIHPIRRGPATILPGQNLSYKREFLVSVGDRLEMLLTPDFNLQVALRRRGLTMCVESEAVVSHEHFTDLRGLMSAHYAYCRLLAGRRAQLGAWTPARRMFYGLAVIPGAPILAAIRLAASLRGRRSLWPAAVRALPVFVAAHLWAALGESLGYLRGTGRAEQELHHWELDTERSIAT